MAVNEPTVDAQDGPEDGHPVTVPGRIRVLVVDDEALMRAGIRLMIDGSAGVAGAAGRDTSVIDVVGEAADGEAALAAVAELEPDVVLMDIRMPRMNGIEAVRELRSSGRRTPVVMLTAFDTDDFLLDALREGATSFLLKDSAPELVFDAIRDAARGQAKFSPAALSRLVTLASARAEGAAADDTVFYGAGAEDVQAEDVYPSDAASPAAERTSGGGSRGPDAPARILQQRPDGITEREWEVGRCVAQGLTNSEIGEVLFLSAATVKTHIASLFTKLHVTNRVQLAIRVLEHEPG